MTARSLIGAIYLIVTSLFCVALACGDSSNQFKPSKSDANIRAIGRRNLAKGTNFYSLRHEQALGKELARQISRSTSFVNDPAVTQYIDQLGQRIARHSDVRMPVTFYVIDNDKVNAFTLPGGYQYVSRGLLLELNSEAELAGVLAHGIASTALRSATKEATKADIAQVAMAPTLGFVPNEWPGAPPQVAGGTKSAVPLIRLESEREYELAADYFGLQYVYVTGYDPESYISLLERVWSRIASTAPSVFSTSPPLGDRVARMQQEIAKILSKRSGVIVSTPAFADFQERLRAWKSANVGQQR